MESQRFSYGSFFKGILLGSILAGGVALFTAPRSGVETRQMLLEKGEQLRDKTVQTIDNARSQVSNVISETLRPADQFVERLGEQADVQAPPE